MDSPVFGSQWNLPSRTRRYPATRQVPVHRQMPVPSPKVVSIPVHFVGSERTRSASAVKIQKVFRGFLVRKNMKRIVTVKREIDEVERRISREEIVDLIRRDSKERLKVNETLMSLLFRLDSVRGVDSGVRDCRKAVIRRAIALQEKVDAIAASDQTVDSETHTETSDPSSELIDGSRSEAVDGIQELSVDCDSAADETLEIKDSICEYSANGALETAPDPAVVSDDCNVDGALQLQNPVEHVIDSGDSKVMSESTLDCCVDSADESKEEMDVTEIGVDSEINANKDVSTPKETVEDPDDSKALPRSSPDSCDDSVHEIKEDVDVAEVIDEIKEDMDVTEVGVDSEINANEEASAPKEIVEDPNSNPLVNECAGVEGNQEHGKEDQSNGELLEKIMEENAKLMCLMTKLFEKNEAQTRLLSSLSQRVEHLERSIMCEKLRKKKRQAAAGQEASPDAKKCGKKL